MRRFLANREALEASDEDNEHNQRNGQKPPEVPKHTNSAGFRASSVLPESHIVLASPPNQSHPHIPNCGSCLEKPSRSRQPAPCRLLSSHTPPNSPVYDHPPSQPRYSTLINDINASLARSGLDSPFYRRPDSLACSSDALIFFNRNESDNWTASDEDVQGLSHFQSRPSSPLPPNIPSPEERIECHHHSTRGSSCSNLPYHRLKNSFHQLHKDRDTSICSSLSKAQVERDLMLFKGFSLPGEAIRSVVKTIIKNLFAL